MFEIIKKTLNPVWNEEYHFPIKSIGIDVLHMSFKDYINWNASKFFISITFEHNGNTYYEEFEYAEKGGSKRLLKNLDTDEVWENSSSISILSTIINPDLAKASIVAMENEQNLITTTPAKRREYLKGLYNLEFKDQLDYISFYTGGKSSEFEERRKNFGRIINSNGWI